MKKLLTILVLATSTASAQTMYKMECIPIYDEDGNLYQMRQVYDHLPTKQDSIDFEKSAKKYMIEIDQAHKASKGIKTYQAVVAEVRVDKKGNVAIRPTSKFRASWYRYYDENVKVGDTIWISKEEAINQ